MLTATDAEKNNFLFAAVAYLKKPKRSNFYSYLSFFVAALPIDKIYF